MLTAKPFAVSPPGGGYLLYYIHSVLAHLDHNSNPLVILPALPRYSGVSTSNRESNGVSDNFRSDFNKFLTALSRVFKFLLRLKHIFTELGKIGKLSVPR